MAIRINGVVLIIATCVLIGCSHNDRNRAREQGERAKEKAHQLADELRHDAHRAKESARRALESSGGSGSVQSPEAKIREGTQELRAAGGRAAEKLDEAGTIAQTKARLAQAVGMSSITDVQVSLEGSTIILKGSVPTEQDKNEAEKAAAQTSGVSRVVNRLRIAP